MFYYVFPMATNSRLLIVTWLPLRVATGYAGLFIATDLEGISGFTFEADTGCEAGRSVEIAARSS